MPMGENLLAASEVCAPGTPLTLPPEPDVQIAARLKVLADPARLRIVQLLAANGSVCACDLEAPLGLSQPTVSHHLRQLTAAGLIARDKRGTWAFYRVEPGAVSSVAGALQALG
ncbi:helix-turn-helix transcriptional regulator [Demequina sp. NBRC 110053]|uniref:ArsR/SmtB family transcription factor n=1 Tax=Demequina sp. NBRC 110053 TaxID=1570342 RepID=UPI001184DF1E|nr:metalloregulator ArsR/SmtB family transcription factor [Demequina sp. NBRC 110053]